MEEDLTGVAIEDEAETELQSDLTANSVDPDLVQHCLLSDYLSLSLFSCS